MRSSAPILRLLPSRETLRLLPLLGPVVAGGFAAAGVAAVALALSGPSLAAVAGVVVLLAAALLAEAFPVPVENFPAGTMSLAAVFILGSALIYGWREAVLIAFLTRGVIELRQRRPLMRFAYNSSVYSLSALAGSLAAGSIAGGGGAGRLLLQVLLAACGFYVLNIHLIAGIVARSTGDPFLPLLRRWVVWTGASFAIMASVSLMLAALWRQSPVLASALAGPLIAVGLYQRSMHSALKAMRLAQTDPLTGLGNHRHFQERLQTELDAAAAHGAPVTVCLLDLDNFKQINDRYGHPAGDKVLTQVAGSLRDAGEAFRLGGDEFALLLPGRNDEEGGSVAQAVVDRLAGDECEHGGTVSFSAGVAAYPVHAADRSELVRVADIALYWAKGEGKNRVRVYRADAPALAELRQLAGGRDREARLKAAASLSLAVDARDAYVGGHSTRVAEIAGFIAQQLGLEPDQVELVRLAGRLHDVGKLAIPEEVLRKHSELTRGEHELLEKHPQIGFQMLAALDVEPVATWVLHHHERWDGTGYPARLAGDRIPLGARILFVADAYDAMTTPATYQGGMTPVEAIAEIERCAGAQFDPEVVEALLAGADELAA